MPTIVISDELHKWLSSIKAKYSHEMTPSRVLDYIVFSIDNENRKELMKMIFIKAKEDGHISQEIAEKIFDNL